MSASEANGAPAPAIFGRTETLISERRERLVWWVVYRAAVMDDFENGVAVAAFSNHADANAYVNRVKVEPWREEESK